MKEYKHSLKISRSCGNITLDGYPIATYSNDELKILKNLLTKVLGEVNEYIKETTFTSFLLNSFKDNSHSFSNFNFFHIILLY